MIRYNGYPHFIRISSKEPHNALFRLMTALELLIAWYRIGLYSITKTTNDSNEIKAQRDQCPPAASTNLCISTELKRLCQVNLCGHHYSSHHFDTDDGDEQYDTLHFLSWASSTANTQSTPLLTTLREILSNSCSLPSCKSYWIAIGSPTKGWIWNCLIIIVNNKQHRKNKN